MTTDLSLDRRTGFPDALHVLLRDFPRDGWDQDPGFHGLVSFWMDRHLKFRRLLDAMRHETDLVLDRSTAADRFASRLTRYGGAFVTDLHGHHQIEDAHYFPALMKKDARLGRGFDILDRDHQTLDGLLAVFVTSANAALSQIGDRTALQDKVGAFSVQLDHLAHLIDRHLTDEEDLIVPIILKYGEAGLG